MGEQPLVDGYDEVNVTEENEKEYPSADGRRGWFYVLETDVQFTLQVRWGDLGAARGLRDLVMKGLTLYVSTPGYANDQHYTLAKLEESGSLIADTSASPDQENPTHGVLTVEGGWKYNLDGSEISYEEFSAMEDKIYAAEMYDGTLHEHDHLTPEEMESEVGEVKDFLGV